MSFDKNKFKKIKRKAISPLISTILLILIAIILVVTFSSWSKLFVEKRMKDTSENITTASEFECSRANLDIESCTINAITNDITLLVHNPSSLNLNGLILSIQAREEVDNNTFKLVGRFENVLKAGHSLLLTTEEDFDYIKEEKTISELVIDNIDLMTLTSLTCPNKSIDITNCYIIE
jgi:flagellin-like protein